MATDLVALPDQLATPPPLPRLWEAGWHKTGWRPYPLQREVLLSPVRNKVFAAGRRAGKSQVGGERLLPEVIRCYRELNTLMARGLRREYWIVGPEYSDAEKEFRVIWNAIKRMGYQMDHPGSYNNPDSGEMSISLFDRRFVIAAKSAKYPETLVGEGLSGVVFSEAAKLKPSVWFKYIRPTLADFSGWAQFGSTPEGKNWFYDLFMIGQDSERTDWASWRSPSWANPYVYPGGVNSKLLAYAAEMQRHGRMDEAKKQLDMITSALGAHPRGIHPEIWAMFLDMSVELFNQEVAALFTEYVGRVFKDFDDEIHVTNDGFRSDWGTYAAVDYGFTNPTVWLLVQVSPDGNRVHVLDEYYESGRTINEAAAEIQSRGLAPVTVRGFYPDPASPGDSRALSQLLRIPARSPGSLEKKDRLEWFRRKLKLGSGGPDGLPALTISRKCPNTIREFNDYRYKETAEQASMKNRAAPEEPLKKDDHTPEALGRLFSGMFGNPHRANRSRQSRARTGR